MHAHLTLNRSVPAPWDVKAGVRRYRRPRVPCLSAEDSRALVEAGVDQGNNRSSVALTVRRGPLESSRATKGPVLP